MPLLAEILVSVGLTQRHCLLETFNKWEIASSATSPKTPAFSVASSGTPHGRFHFELLGLFGSTGHTILHGRSDACAKARRLTPSRRRRPLRVEPPKTAVASGSGLNEEHSNSGYATMSFTAYKGTVTPFSNGSVKMCRKLFSSVAAALLAIAASVASAADYQITETDEQIKIVTPQLEAVVRKKGYVTGVAARSLLDKKTGFRDAGFGLDIVDRIMEPGSDRAYRDRLDPELIYRFGNAYHGKQPKRSIEGPQICTQARQLTPVVIRGKDFVAVKQQFKYKTAAPGAKAGSLWTQLLVFPVGKRYFLSMDRIDAVNRSDAMFLRIDMPGHIRHTRGDTFSQVYLSYHGTIPASEFSENFAPDDRFNYRRDRDETPERFIRAYRLRDPSSGKEGPYLAGMTLEPSVVHEAWCHQRGYVCMIEEFGGRPIAPGESFQAAFVVGYFDSIEEMQQVYDRYRGHTGLQVTAEGWKLVK